jgi:hypothetical protein
VQLAQVARVTEDTESDVTFATASSDFASPAVTREGVLRQWMLDELGNQRIAAKYFIQLVQSSVFKKAEQKLEDMNKLLRNWNSYGAEPPNDETRTRATKVLTVLQERFFPPTKVVPSSEGGVAICFIRDDRYADIEFLNTGEILAVTYRGAEEPTVWPIENDTLDLAIDRIRRHFLA